VINIYQSSFRIFQATFPKEYLEEIYLTGNPTKDIIVKRTRGYEMLDPADRGAFFEVVVGLLRAISAGVVRTGYVWAGLPNNPIHGVPHPLYGLTQTQLDASQTDATTTDSNNSIDMEAEGPGEKMGEEKGVAGIVQRLEDVDILEVSRGRSPRTSPRKTSTASSKSPRKTSPRKSSPKKQSGRFEPYPI
jgi:hypothetical protein